MNLCHYLSALQQSTMDQQRYIAETARQEYLDWQLESLYAEYFDLMGAIEHEGMSPQLLDYKAYLDHSIAHIRHNI